MSPRYAIAADHSVCQSRRTHTNDNAKRSKKHSKKRENVTENDTSKNREERDQSKQKEATTVKTVTGIETAQMSK